MSILSDRKTIAPWGLFGGAAAAGSHHRLVRADGTIEDLPSKTAFTVQAGDRLIAETAGGGGYGPAADRPVALAEADRLAGFTTAHGRTT